MNEPVLISVALGNLAGIVINCLLAWGITMSEQQQSTTIALVQTVATLIGAVIARTLVWTKSSKNQAVVDALNAGD